MPAIPISAVRDLCALADVVPSDVLSVQITPQTITFRLLSRDINGSAWINRETDEVATHWQVNAIDWSDK